MTVHGAKGLQAPIVILPDTCTNPRGQGPRVFEAPRPGHPDGEVAHLLWPPPGHSGVSGLAPAKTESEQSERDEYHRLLYVAMTRACDRLYVCGWQGIRRRETDCWYDLIAEGLQPHLSKTRADDGKTVYRMVSAQERMPKDKGPRSEETEASSVPAWALTPATPERVRTRLAPSRLALNALNANDTDAFGPEQPPLGPRALASDLRFARGRLVHSLLEHLPEVPTADQERAARTFVAARGTGLPAAMQEEIVGETLAIVRDKRFAPLFAPGSLAEVPVVARFGDGEEGFDLAGQIDRLSILDEDLLILDYKTNRPPPTAPDEVAQSYINQLAAYRLALGKMFPGKRARGALLWTDGPRLMEIPSTLLEAAERDMLGREPTLTP